MANNNYNTLSIFQSDTLKKVGSFIWTYFLLLLESLSYVAVLTTILTGAASFVLWVNPIDIIYSYYYFPILRTLIVLAIIASSITQYDLYSNE